MPTAVIAGGTSGIGRAVVERLVRRKYQVCAIGRTEEHAADLQASVSNSPGDVSVILGDVCQADTLDAVAKWAEEHGGKLDALVNSAGTISPGGIEVESVELWQQVVTVNLTGVFAVTKRMLPFMKHADAPSIVNVSSVCSLRPCTSLSYSVSKAGLDMMTKVLARELAQHGIRVNAVNPGVVRTNLQLSAGLMENQAAYEQWTVDMAALHPLGRIGEPEDVASAIEFLLGPGASWVTGGILSVDGGRAVG